MPARLSTAGTSLTEVAGAGDNDAVAGAARGRAAVPAQLADDGAFSVTVASASAPTALGPIALQPPDAVHNDHAGYGDSRDHHDGEGKPATPR